MIVDALRVLALSTLASSVAIVLILLLRKLLRLRFGAQAAYALWALAPIAALIALLPAPVSSIAPAMDFAAVVPAAERTVSPTVAAAPSIDLLPWFALAWLLGTIGCAAALVRQQRRFVRALGNLSPHGDDTDRAQATAGCPALVGAWRPRIVLPADFEQRYDCGERELILAHERAHRARGDAQANALAAAMRCVYWFNPLFHFAASRFRFDQELACDASVISRFPQARRCYADAMLKTQLADLGLPAGCHWQSSHPLKERIAMLKQPLPGRARAALGLGLVATLVLCASYAAWAAQPQAAKARSASQAESASYDKLVRIPYPQAQAAPGDCMVLVKLRVDEHGGVADLLELTIHGSTPQPLCRRWGGQTASTIMAKWHFNPAMRDGKPVASTVVVPVVFTAHADEAFDAAPIPAGALDTIRVSPPQA